MENEVDNDVINEIAENKVNIDASFSVEDLLGVIANSTLDNTELIKEIRDSNEMEGIAYNDAEINDIVVVIVGKKLLECTAKEAVSAYEKVTFITIKDESRIYVVPLNINVGIRVGTQDVDVQHPLPVNGDSVYEKDINIERSSIGGFSGAVIDLFNDANNVITDSSSANIKNYTVYFKRPITTSEITLAAGLAGNFSNAKLYLYDIAGNQLLSIDNSTDNTKYTKYVFNNVPQTFIGYKVEFHTTDTVSIAFNYIHKSIDVQANLKALDIDTGLLDDVKGHDNFLLTTTHNEMLSENHIVNSSPESIIGTNETIGTAGFQILSPVLYTQPPDEVAMELVSSSIEDSEGGTGINQVTIEYFNNDIPWIKYILVNSLNGTTPVPLANTNTYRIHKMYANKIGSNTTAVGTITLQNIGGGTTYGSILPGTSIMERAIFYVQAGHRVVVTDILLGCLTNGGVIWRLVITQEDENGNLAPIGQLSVQSADSTFALPLNIGFSLENPDGKRFAILVAVKGRVANQEGTASLRGYEEPI